MMKEISNQKFKISLFSECWSNIDGSIIRKDKEIVIYAPSCCEAIVKAVKQNRAYGYTYLKYEKI